jgi:creatinine amidohydrolase
MKRFLAIVTFLSILLFSCAQQETASKETAAAAGKVLTIGNLSWADVDALDRERTLFLLTVGMLEEHGPHLPIAADTIAVEYEAGKVAERLSQALPDWKIVMMPVVHYGSSGANQVGGNQPIHPGTYGLRQSTLRSLIADIGGQIAQNRFKWIFVMNGHGAPTHHTAVNEACDFVSGEFKATMLNVSGLYTADAAIQSQAEKLVARHFSPAELSSIGMDVHAGVSETSALLFVRPDLVRPSYRTLPDYSVHNLKDSREVGMKPGWPGYFSSPAKATEAYGRDFEGLWVEGMTEIILRAVRGENLLNHPRWPENVSEDAVMREIVEGVLAPEREFERKLDRWLADRNRR